MRKKIALLVLVTTMLNVFPVLAAPSGKSVTTNSLGPSSEISEDNTTVSKPSSSKTSVASTGPSKEVESTPGTTTTTYSSNISLPTVDSSNSNLSTDLSDVYSSISSKSPASSKTDTSSVIPSMSSSDSTLFSSIEEDDTIPEQEKNVQKTVTPTVKYGIVDDVPTTLSEVSLPDINFKRPSNMPNINLNLSTIFNSSQEDLTSKGFGVKKFNLQDKQMDITFASQGTKTRLTDENLTNYLTDLEKNYLPQIQASVDAADGVEYDPIDLSSKWNLMSQEDSQIMNLDAGNYATMKQDLKNTISIPTLDQSQSAAYEAALNSF